MGLDACVYCDCYEMLDDLHYSLGGVVDAALEAGRPICF
jgi:hypothetical protein